MEHNVSDEHGLASVPNDFIVQVREACVARKCRSGLSGASTTVPNPGIQNFLGTRGNTWNHMGKGTADECHEATCNEGRAHLHGS